MPFSFLAKSTKVFIKDFAPSTPSLHELLLNIHSSNQGKSKESIHKCPHCYRARKRTILHISLCPLNGIFFQCGCLSLHPQHPGSLSSGGFCICTNSRCKVWACIRVIIRRISGSQDLASLYVNAELALKMLYFIVFRKRTMFFTQIGFSSSTKVLI